MGRLQRGQQRQEIEDQMTEEGECRAGRAGGSKREEKGMLGRTARGQKVRNRRGKMGGGETAGEKKQWHKPCFSGCLKGLQK